MSVLLILNGFARPHDSSPAEAPGRSRLPDLQNEANVAGYGAHLQSEAKPAYQDSSRRTNMQPAQLRQQHTEQRMKVPEHDGALE